MIAAWACGALLTLAPPVWAITLGLTLCAACGMLCQTISTGYVTMIAKEGRSSAVGLYVTCFYVGGSFGAFLPGLAWDAGGWPACVAMVVAMQRGHGADRGARLSGRDRLIVTRRTIEVAQGEHMTHAEPRPNSNSCARSTRRPCAT